MTFSENEVPTAKLTDLLGISDIPESWRSPITRKYWARFAEAVESQMATATARLEPLKRAR